jgi:hypothetical protein
VGDLGTVDRDVLRGKLGGLAQVDRHELASIESSWQRRHGRRWRVRPIIPTGQRATLPRHRLRTSAGAGAGFWDDQAERDGRHLVALRFVAGAALRRAEAAEALRVSMGRLERACAFLSLSPPHGLRLVEPAAVESGPHARGPVRMADARSAR